MFLKKIQHLFTGNRHKKKDTWGWLKCPSCKKKMGEEVEIKCVRQSDFLDHYLCGCGVVSHWLFNIVMTCVGYGRFRNTDLSERGYMIGGFKPNRLHSDDLLWWCPRTSTVYFFYEQLLCRFPLTETPTSINDQLHLLPLSPETLIKIGGNFYRYDGFSFQAFENLNPHNSDLFYVDVKTICSPTLETTSND